MSEIVRLKLNEDGRVVIPAAVRKKLGMEAGDELLGLVDDFEFRITTQQLRIRRAQQHARRYVKPGISLADELIADRRKEAKRELE